MPDMGGLRRLMPVTFLAMTAGLAALAGIPPFAGFFSKEAVLGAAEETALHGEGPAAAWAGWLVLGVGLATVGVTAAYVTRLWLMTFFGPPRSPVAAHESPPSMRWPLVALAVPTVALGASGCASPGCPSGRPPASPGSTAPTPPRSSWASRRWTQASLHLGAVTSVLSVVLAVAGAAAVVSTWRLEPLVDPTLGLRARTALERAFYVDDVYDRVFVRPVRAATRRRGLDRRRRRRWGGAGHRVRDRPARPARVPHPGAATCRPTSPGCSPGCSCWSSGW